MSTILRNLHYALRQLRKSPVFTIAAVLTLALGIGATTAIYTVVYATLIAPMPYPNPDQLVIVWSKIQGFRNGVSAGDFLDWQEQNTSFQALKAFTGTSFNMAGKEAPEMVRGQMVTPGMYNMLGNRFALGRDLLPEEGVDGKDHVVVLMNKLWKRLGADPNIVGKQIKLDQKPYTVVGVLGAGQADRLDQDVIVPLVFKPEQKNHDFHWMLVMGRLKPGVTLKQAQSDMDAVTARIAQVNPRSNKGWAARVDPLQNDFLGDNVKLTLWLLLGAVGCVLLIACVNVANLLLARGTSRTREISIRSAVGATRTDVFIQFVTESLVLAFLGGAVGVAIGYAMLHGLIAAMPQGTLPSEADLSLNRAFSQLRSRPLRFQEFSLAAHLPGTLRALILRTHLKKAAAPAPAKFGIACDRRWSSVNSPWHLRCLLVQVSPCTASGISPMSISAYRPTTSSRSLCP